MKIGKRILALLLAAIMVLGIGVTALAEGGNYTLTIENTAANHEYKVYQLLKGTVSANESNVLTNITAGSSLKLKDGESLADFLDTISSLRDSELGDEAYDRIDFDKPVTSVIGNGSSQTVEGLEGGYYVIVDGYASEEGDKTVALSRNMVTVAGDATVSVKSETPNIDKKIVNSDEDNNGANNPLDGDGKVNTAAIGDVIKYEVSGAMPDMTGYTYYRYQIVDTLSVGLTLNQDSFKVFIGSKEIANDQYQMTPSTNADGTTSFTLAFTDLKKLVADQNIQVGAGISITYNATINEKAVVGLDPNTNTVKLVYSNNPNDSGTGSNATGVTPDRMTKTYVTQLTITKVDGAGLPLQGAEFTLAGTNLNKVILSVAEEFVEAADGETPEYYKLKNGTYTKQAPTADTENLYEDGVLKYVKKGVVTTTSDAVESKSVVGEVGEDGLLTFTGLNAGTYTLTETKTPDGYNTIDPITFTISASLSEDGKTFSWSSDDDKVSLDGAGVFGTTVKNIKGITLPSTGGMGTLLFVVAGIAIIGGAGTLLAMKKRRRNAR